MIWLLPLVRDLFDVGAGVLLALFGLAAPLACWTVMWRQYKKEDQKDGRELSVYRMLIENKRLDEAGKERQ